MMGWRLGASTLNRGRRSRHEPPLAPPSSDSCGGVRHASAIINVAPPLANVPTSAAAAWPSGLCIACCSCSALLNHSSAMKWYGAADPSAVPSTRPASKR